MRQELIAYGDSYHNRVIHNCSQGLSPGYYYYYYFYAKVRKEKKKVAFCCFNDIILLSLELIWYIDFHISKEFFRRWSSPPK
jgi:hypothetical protein